MDLKEFESKMKENGVKDRESERRVAELSKTAEKAYNEIKEAL